MATHFLADLHLDDADGPFAQCLQRYLANEARQAEAVYVLGDLFEVWIGDDGSLSRHRATIDAFASLNESGVPLYFMRGNRDFAIGEAFQRQSGMRVLDDPYVLNLYGIPTLLSHGDLFCTDDRAHQAFRARYMDPDWRQRRLRLPLWSRQLLAAWARRKSRRGNARKPQHIMDVSDNTVREYMHEYGVRRLIHGHTHRPDVHAFELDGAEVERIVLPDWRPGQTGVLIVDQSGRDTMWLT